MTDPELLELAAKAAGIAVWTLYHHGESFGLMVDKDHCIQLWNPLTDDGDALRLAVKLELDMVRPYVDYHSIAVWLDHMGDFIEEPLDKDPYAATRRAIVRAAAEIGKGMP